MVSVRRREERERMEMDTTDLSYIKVVADCGTCLWRAVFALAKQYRYQISQHDSICSRRSAAEPATAMAVSW